jgi:hypothetical protein
MSQLTPLDRPCVAAIGWCWRRLSPTAKRWLVVELRRRLLEGQ